MSQKPPGPGEADAASRIAGSTTPKDAASAPPVPRWCCPLCGSDRLTVYYTEHRASSVWNDPDQDAPYPDYARDVLIEMEPAVFIFACDACGARAIGPVRGEVHL